MRQTIRERRETGHERVAVVCGAWHVPALRRPLPPRRGRRRDAAGAAQGQGRDDLGAVDTRRLAATGYGAGITSPGWYHHLFTAPDRPIERWLTEVAGLLRARGPAGRPAPTSSRRSGWPRPWPRCGGRPLAGLAEVTEATRAVLCDGDELRRGAGRPTSWWSASGSARCPTTRRRSRWRRDLRRAPPAAAAGAEAPVDGLELDLRQPIDLARSRLLHRLRLLGVGWGTPADATAAARARSARRGGSPGEPEFAVDWSRPAVWGTTVSPRPTARGRPSSAAPVAIAGRADRAGRARACSPTCRRRCAAARALADRAALDADVGAPDGRAAGAGPRPALRRRARHRHRGAARGRRRRWSSGSASGCRGAVTGLDDDDRGDHATAASTRVHAAIGCCCRATAERRDRWLDSAGGGWSTATDLHGLLAGRFVRLLLDAARRSTTTPPAAAARCRSACRPRQAAWIEGFLAGGGLLLVHDAELLGLLDDWLRRARGRRVRRCAAPAAADVRRLRRAGARADRRTRCASRRRAPATGRASERVRRRTGAPRWLPSICRFWASVTVERRSTERQDRTAALAAAAGRGAADALGAHPEPRRTRRSTRALAALYDAGARRRRRAAAARGGLGASAPQVARWLGDIRTYFPSSVVQVMQRDAIERLNLTSMLLEPELLDAVAAGRPPGRHPGQPQPGDAGDHQATARAWSSARSSRRSSGGSPTRPGPR